MIIDNIENFEKSQKDDKNINKNLLIKISEGRNFGKDISNEINNINKIKDIHNKQNINTKNLSTINGININFLKNKDKKPVIKNNDENKIKNKNNENIQNNIIQLKFIKNVNANQNNKKIDIGKNIQINNEIKNKINPIEEYEEDIMKNLFTEETKNRPDYKMLQKILSQNDIISRFSSLNLAIYLNVIFNFRQETLYLACNLFDRFLLHLKQSNKLNMVSIKIVMLTCIFISAKYEEIYPPFLEEYKEFLTFSENDIFKLEYDILEYTGFNLHIYSPYLFLSKFYLLEDKENLKIFYGAQFILELSIISLVFCAYKPSLQAALSLYLSKKFLDSKVNQNNIWTSKNVFNTGYSENEIKKYLKIPLNLIKEYFSGNIVKDISKTALFRKFNSIKYCEVWKIFKDLVKN